MNQPSTFKCWLVAFFVLTVIGLGIQLVVIPHLAPSLDGGDGLVKNTDSIVFHRAAVFIADTIEAGGWRHWQLRPDEWGHVGVSSALYALTVPKPWVIVPVAAASMATSLVLLMHILRQAGVAPLVAALAVLPALFLPSTVMFAALWHKDHIAIPATFALILGVLLWWSGERIVTGAVSMAAGLFGLWMVRDHIIQVMVGASMIGVAVAALSVRWTSRAHLHGFARMTAAVVVMAGASQLIPSWTEVLQVSDTQWQAWSSASREHEMRELAGETTASEPAGERQSAGMARPGEGSLRPPLSEVDSPAQPAPPAGWRPSRWIPAAVDQRMASFGEVREASKRGTGHGCSSVDTHVVLTSAEEMVTYAPRAGALALFAPFPRAWLGSACSGGGRLIPLLSAGEMLLAYVAFAGIPLLIWQLRRHPPLWYLLALCAAALVVHGFIFVNVGTMFRTRYAWFQILVALGIAGVGNLWASRQRPTKAT